MTWRDLTPWAAPPVRPHELVRLDDGRRRCAVCSATWASKPRGHAEHCPAVPLYLHRRHLPADLLTQTDARRHGMAVDPDPVAALQVLQPGTGHLLRVPLYRTRQTALPWADTETP